MDVETESILLLSPKNTPQHQGQTNPRGKRMEKDVQRKWSEEASWWGHFNICWSRPQAQTSQKR